MRLLHAGHCLFEGPLPIKGICDLVCEYAKEFEGVEVMTSPGSWRGFTTNLLAVLTDGSLVSSSNNDLIVWGDCVRKIECTGHTRVVCALVALNDGKFASGSLDRSVRVWNSEGACIVLPTIHNPQVGALVALTPGKFASSSQDSIFVWDEDGTCLNVFDLVTPRQVYSLFHLGDDKFAACAWGGMVSVYDARAGSLQYSLPDHSYYSSVTIGALPGGKFATCGSLHDVCVWTTSTGEQFAQLEGHAGNVKAMIVLPNGVLVTGSNDYTIRGWEVSSGACLFTLHGHTQSVSAMVMLPDGKLASSAYDSTVKIWNLDTLDCALTIRTTKLNWNKFTSATHTSIVQLAVLPDCKLVGSSMGSVGGSSMFVWA